MFSHLSIRNYILIQELEVDFHDGLSMITGETGAGKSILLGALGLLAGQRADSSALLDASRKCIVEGTFALHNASWKNWFDGHDLEYEPDTTIRREIASDGKSRAFVNDSPVNLSVLKDLGAQLIDIHSQHQNIYLQSAVFQLRILDTYAQQLDAVAAYNREYLHCRKLQDELDELENEANRYKSELDYHRFRFEELEKAKLREGEQEDLENELKALTHAEDIRAGLVQVSALLDSEEVSVVQMLKSATGIIGRLKTLLPSAESYLQRIDSSLIELKDIALEAEQLAENMVHNPEQVKAVNERLDLLYALQQKHRVSTVRELLDIRNDLDVKIQKITNYDMRIEKLREQAARSQQHLSVMSGTISAGRQQAVAGIEERIHTLIKQLGIPNAVFKAVLNPVDQFTPYGTDDVQFLFSANRQQNLQEIGKVASGGEISRLMLSIKAAIAEKIVLPTLIFDEIDSGVSGEIAGKMGNILEQMAQFTQIINITHLPQVAAKGRHHYKVYKEDLGQATQTKLQALNSEQRIMEIAKMLSGEKVTAAAMENAKYLLGQI
jgi:DNA repair protein RecN (Recombination protein N)